MHPSSILSYYPNYSILDEVVSLTNCNTLNIFVDLKNALQSIYLEYAVKALISSTEDSRFIDTSIFSSVISFLAWHKQYAYKRDKLKINMFLFYESGRSYYHQNIDKNYKSSRHIDDLYGLSKEKQELFGKIVSSNLQLIEKACNKLPNVFVLRMLNLDADFIPYFLIKNKLVSCDDKSSSIIYSNDHDLLQVLSLGNNVFVYRKTYNSKKLIRSGEAVKEAFKVESYPDTYLPVMMAIIGDSGDNVTGIKGLGAKRVSQLIEDVVTINGGVENINDVVFNGKELFSNLPNSDGVSKNLKLVIDAEKQNQTISKNLKLVSFEVLSKFLEEPNKTEMLDRKNKILYILHNKEIAEMSAMEEALKRTSVYLLEGDLQWIYF